MLNKLKEYLPNLSIFFLLLFSFLVVIFFSSQNCVSYDDFLCCFWGLKDTILDCFFPSEAENGGGYFVFLLTKLTTFGFAYTFNIHPEDFATKYNPVIKGILFVCFFYFSAKMFLFRNRKKKWLLVSFLLFFIVYIFYFLLLSNGFCIVDNITFYRYIFSTFFYFVLFFLLYKNVLFPRLRMVFCEQVLFVFSTLVVASNLETVLFSFALFFAFLLFSNQIVKFNNKKNLYKFNSKFYLVCFLFFITSFFYVNSPMFHHNFDWRGFGTFVFSFAEIIKFLTLFFNIYICQNILCLTLFILLIAMLLKKRKNSITMKKIVFASSMLLSIFIVYFSLFLFGKNGYDGNYWIADFKLAVFFKIMILSPFFILFDDFLRHLNQKYKKKCTIISIFILIFLTLFHLSTLYKYKDFILTLQPYKKINYINEKMYRYFKLKNRTPYLIKINPNRIGDLWLPFPFFEIFPGDADLFSNKLVCNSEETRTSVYLEKLYDDEKSSEVKFCFSDDALDKFFELGGVITKHEIDNLNFSNLQNSDYVLNNKDLKSNILSKDDILSIYKTYH